MTTCNICCENFNKSTRKNIECPYCNENACSSCIKKYLLGGIDKFSNCMYCRKSWSDDFFRDSMTKSFMNNEWKQHLETILLDEEKSRLPETLQIETDKKEKLIRIQNLNNTIKRLNNEIFNIRRSLNSNKISVGGGFKFFRNCPSNDCNGFLSTKWKCGVCNINVCNKCGIQLPNKNDDDDEKEDSHVCNEDEVKTMELLKKDTKPCIQCGTPIYKISGCSQMWCTKCHCSFDWKTGQKSKGIIHNPHYYEWQRTQENVGNVDINNLGCIDIQIYRNINFIDRAYPIFFKIHRFRGDLLHAMETKNNQLQRQTEEYKYNLRVNHLFHNKPLDEIKILLQRQYKKNKKTQEYLQIYQTFLDLSREIFLNMFYQNQQYLLSRDNRYYITNNKYCKYSRQFEELRNYINGCIKIVNKKYNSKSTRKYIDENWRRLIL